MFKNVFSKQGIATTIMSIVGIILMLLVGVGLVTADQSEAIRTALQSLFDAIPGGQFTVIFLAALAVIQQVVMLFTKDPKVTDDSEPKPKGK